MSGLICVDVGTGAVVHLPVPTATEVNSVNATLNQFADCVRSIIDLFPFYDEESDWDEWERAAEEIRRVVLSVDESVFEHNGFWDEFASDVAIGDYRTELLGIALGDVGPG